MSSFTATATATISGVDFRSQQPVVLEESITRSGPTSASSNAQAPAGIVAGASASCSASANDNGLFLMVASGVQALNLAPAQAVSSVAGAMVDIVRLLDATDTDATQIVQFSIFDSQGNPTSWAPVQVSLNGDQVTTQFNQELVHTSTVPHANLASTTLSLNGNLRLAFQSPDSEGDQRTVRVSIRSIAFLDHLGQPLSWFSYTTDSGNAYTVMGGKFVPLGASAAV